VEGWERSCLGGETGRRRKECRRGGRGNSRRWRRREERSERERWRGSERWRGWGGFSGLRIEDEEVRKEKSWMEGGRRTVVSPPAHESDRGSGEEKQDAVER
jgi:hypothetical protein